MQDNLCRLEDRTNQAGRNHASRGEWLRARLERSRNIPRMSENVAQRSERWVETDLYQVESGRNHDVTRWAAPYKALLERSPGPEPDQDLSARAARTQHESCASNPLLAWNTGPRRTMEVT